MNLVGIKEYSRLCGVTETVILKRLRRGDIKAKKASGNYLIDVDTYPPVGAGSPGRPSSAQVAASLNKS